MSAMRARMFNRRANGKALKPEMILSTISPYPNQAIADIGSGGGYYTFRFAEKVGAEGMVYSVDTNHDFLRYIEDECRKMGLKNVKTLDADALDRIPDGSLDLVFLRNVYHHLKDPVRYFKGLSGKIKKDGRIVIIDYKALKGFSLISLFGHHTNEKRIVYDLGIAGFALHRSLEFLPKQSFLVFLRKRGDE